MAKVSMIVGGERITVDNDPRLFTGAELGAVERFTGMTVVEFGSKLQDETLSTLAWSALAWIAARRAGQLIPWDAFCENLSMLDLLESVQEVADEQPVANRAERRKAARATT